MDFSGYWEDGEQVLSILRKLRAVSIRIILGLACLLFGGWWLETMHKSLFAKEVKLLNQILHGIAMSLFH